MKKRIAHEGGFTLLELLAALAISTIVSTIVYSMFITGSKLYQKIQVEGQQRDDADYIATMVLNKMYENAPKLVEEYEDGAKKGVQLTVSGGKIVEQYIVEEDTHNDKRIQIYFEGGKLFIQDRGIITEIESSSANLNAENSAISLGTNGLCNQERTRCSSGTVELTLDLQADESFAGSFIEREPITLNSSFGF